MDYCNAMKSYLDCEWLSGRDHTEPEKSRKFLAFLDHPMFEPVVNDLKKMINQRRSTFLEHKLILMMLPGTIQNHSLFKAPPDTESISTEQMHVANYM